jgi:hypothetical protein
MAQALLETAVVQAAGRTLRERGARAEEVELRATPRRRRT